MKCGWCQKPLRWWQSKKELDGGFLKGMFGQFQLEHSACQVERRKHPSIAARIDARRIEDVA